MTQPLAPGMWTGHLTLDLRNARNWDVGELEVAVRRDTVEVRHHGRSLASLDRDAFREWMIRPQCAHRVDETVWTCVSGVTVMTVGYSVFRVTSESLANLKTVI